MADNEAEIEKLEINALSIIISNIDIARGPSVPDSPMSCKTPSTFIHVSVCNKGLSCVYVLSRLSCV